MKRHDFGGHDTAVLVGIVSWGVEGCFTEYPSVFTNVAKYSEWIISNTDCKVFDGLINCPNYYDDIYDYYV